METRSIEITVKSASNLKKANAAFMWKTKAYAVGFIHGGGKQSSRSRSSRSRSRTSRSRSSRSEHRTCVDKENGTNPSWNEAMSFTLREAMASLQQDHLLLTLQIWNAAAWGQPHLIGHVTVPLKEFLKQPVTVRSYNCQVLTPSGKPKGILNLSVKIGNKTKIQVKQHTGQPRSHAHITSQGNQQPASQALMQVAGCCSNFS